MLHLPLMSQKPERKKMPVEGEERAETVGTGTGHVECTGGSTHTCSGSVRWTCSSLRVGHYSPELGRSRMSQTVAGCLPSDLY